MKDKIYVQNLLKRLFFEEDGFAKFSWLGGGNDDDKDKDKDKDKELPPEIEERFKASEKNVETLIDKKLAGLNSITEYIETEKKDKETRAAAEAERKRKEAEDKNKKTPEEIAADLLSDPARVINEITGPQANAILMIRADQVKREVFQDRANDFPYYDGDIKKEVDELLAKQSLQFRNDPSSIENVYHTVIGKKMKDISEGKIKSRFAQAGGGVNSNVGEGDKGDKNITITPDIEKAARLVGLKPQDYVELLKKDEDFAGHVI